MAKTSEVSDESGHNMRTTLLVAIVAGAVAINSIIFIGFGATRPLQDLKTQQDDQWDSRMQLQQVSEGVAAAAGIAPAARDAGAGAPWAPGAGGAVAELLCVDRPGEGGCHSWWAQDEARRLHRRCC